MSEEIGEDWNDQSRADLRESISSNLLGELRLARMPSQEILTNCRETYIEDDCPEEEWDTFLDFMNQEFDRLSAQVESEKADWPAQTDCDRLDQVERTLREKGILLWQASPCCDTCTLGELGDRIDFIEQNHPGFAAKVRGYAFFIDQNLPDMLADRTQINVCLGYGAVEIDESAGSDSDEDDVEPTESEVSAEADRLLASLESLADEDEQSAGDLNEQDDEAGVEDDQDEAGMPEMTEEEQAAAAEYEKHALAIAEEVCEALIAGGFDFDWNRQMSRKICFNLNWQRRTILE